MVQKHIDVPLRDNFIKLDTQSDITSDIPRAEIELRGWISRKTAALKLNALHTNIY